jgi:hypothetical protein
MPHKLTAPFQIDQEHFLDKLLEGFFDAPCFAKRRKACLAGDYVNQSVAIQSLLSWHHIREVATIIGTQILLRLHKSKRSERLKMIARNKSAVAGNSKSLLKKSFGRRSPLRYKIERLGAKFSGKVFLCASVDWPDGWMPKHCLDLPRELSTGTWGHELWLREEESDLSVMREDVVAEVAEKNCEEMSRKPEANERPFYWSCIIEVGDVFGDGLGVFKIIDGVGLLNTAICNRVIRVVKATAAEIEKYSQPSKRKVVA